LETYLKGGSKQYLVQFRYRTKAGGWIWIRGRGKIVARDAAGNPTRMIGTHTDITASKTMQAELSKANRQLNEALNFQQLLMDINTDLIFVKDDQFRITQANPAFFDLFPPQMHDRVIGYTTFEAFTDEQVEGFLVEDRKAFNEGYSEVIETAGNRTLLTKKIRFVDDNDRPYILGVARDVSDFKRTEDQLRQVNQELEEFAYRTSHDLRSPLVSSKRLLDIILLALRNGEVERAIGYVELILKSMTKLEGLVKDIMRLTKLRHADSDPIPVDFADLINDSVRSVRHMEGFDRIHWDINVHFAHTVRVDKSLLVSAIDNLISNAVKYQNPEEPRPTVIISARANSHTLKFSIEDNGLGFPETSKQSIFAMFKRFHPKVSFGSGLGLYMARHCVHKLGGDIDYNDAPKGSRFDISVPIKDKIAGSSAAVMEQK
jgi:PAS domain S-box-containing protein